MLFMSNTRLVDIYNVVYMMLCIRRFECPRPLNPSDYSRQLLGKGVFFASYLMKTYNE